MATPYTDTSMLRYAITSRNIVSGSANTNAELLARTAGWIKNGIELIQLREPDLPAATLVMLARTIVEQIGICASPTKLLLNSRADIALAAGAHGVHLTAAPGELTPEQVRTVYAAANRPPPIVTVSCHTLPEVLRAREYRVDAVLFAPVFEKPLPGQLPRAGQGLERLHEASLAAAPVPVYALGGVTEENSVSCLQAGAAGVAGIRLFHE
ncbi:MAG: thiamine phosphate synthase [Acidobacteriota bacterium]|nr:thiamine phosphate synthase [Acidobacteriota bacterium]